MSDLITAAEVAKLQKSGNDVVLVCAYDDAGNHQRIGIDGSKSFPEFQKALGSQPKDRTVVFYCDCPHDELAKEKTATFREQGYNAVALDGGVNAWQNETLA
jgi:rhodanese-related sulfurtransferase